MSEEILQENEESKNPFIASLEKLSDDEKREKFKGLVRYVESDSFKSLLKEYQEKLEDITEDIRKEAYGRKKVEATRSKLDLYAILATEAGEIARKIDNEDFQNYLLNSYVASLDSAVMYKVEEGFDIPLYSNLDIMKNKASVYNSLQFYADACIGFYDVDTKLMAEKKLAEKLSEDGNKNNPYSE